MKSKILKNIKLDFKKSFNLAIKYHNRNYHEKAIKFYKKILKLYPNNYKVLFNLGTIYAQVNQFYLAKKIFLKLIKLNPKFFCTYYNLGIVFQKLGDYKKAITSYKKAISLNAIDFASYNNLGNIYKNTQEFKKAIHFYKKAIKVNPLLSDVYYNLGIVFQELGNHKQAITSYKKTISLKKNDPTAYNNLGAVFNELGEHKKAILCFKKSIKIKPNNPNAYNGISIILQIQGKHGESVKYSKKAMSLRPNSILAHRLIANVEITQLKNFKKAIKQSYQSVKVHHRTSNFINNSISVTRLKHDVEQAKYLFSNKHKVNGLKKFIKVGHKILKRKKNSLNRNNINKSILLNKDEIKFLLPYYKENFIYKPKKIIKKFINPHNDWNEIERKYFNDVKQIMYIDNFLSEDAITELNKFCLASKVWNREHKNKYLGATSDRGFISTIHLKIATDLKKNLPKIFGKHRLQTFWAYKYEPKISKGINIHADSAVVNLNFWITPNKYNLNKNSGGLRVYDVPTPKNWPFAKYNRNTEDILKFLKKTKSNYIDIPHRYNRAVLFNSAYFHQTQEVNFRDVYEGRRINITYLFGDRNFYVPV